MTFQTISLVIGMLFGILALIGVAAKLFRFFSAARTQSNSGRTLVLRESIALDPRRRIHLVQCGQRQVMLLTGGGQDLVIGWLQDP